MCSWHVNSSVSHAPSQSTLLRLARARAASSLMINIYASQVCRLCPPIHALFQCDLPPLPRLVPLPRRRRQHCCMPVAPPALDCPCTHRDLPHPVPVTPVCWPNSSRRTGPTRQSPLSSARSAGSPPDQGGKSCNSMLPPATF
jgi:hypothetical protein